MTLVWRKPKFDTQPAYTPGPSRLDPRLESESEKQGVGLDSGLPSISASAPEGALFMSSQVHFKSPKVCSAIPLACALVGFGTVATHAAWNAAGTVKTATGTALSAVAVTVKDSSANLKVTTDATGAFTIGSSTGIFSSTAPTDFSVRQNGNELLIAFPGEGTLGLQLVDISGATLWKGSAALAGGYANVALPTSERRCAAVLRVSLGSHIAYQPLTLLGGEGLRVTTRTAARSLATNPTLVFKNVGYADTSYTMISSAQTGIAVVMRDSTSPVATTCTLPTGPSAGSGSFTRYYFGQNPHGFVNGVYTTACGYKGVEPNGATSDSMRNLVSGKYFAAIPSTSDADFTSVGMCGACAEITGPNGTKIVATITDECPPHYTDEYGNLQPNQPCIDNPKGHLDLGAGGFDQLAFGSGYPRNTTWKFVACPIKGNVVIRIKDSPTSQIYVENSILPIKGISVGGTQATELSYGPWDIRRGAAGSTLVITDYSDRTITYTVPAGAATETDINTGLQFPACK